MNRLAWLLAGRGDWVDRHYSHFCKSPQAAITFDVAKILPFNQMICQIWYKQTIITFINKTGRLLSRLKDLGATRASHKPDTLSISRSRSAANRCSSLHDQYESQFQRCAYTLQHAYCDDRTCQVWKKYSQYPQVFCRQSLDTQSTRRVHKAYQQRGQRSRISNQYFPVRLEWSRQTEMFQATLRRLWCFHQYVDIREEVFQSNIATRHLIEISNETWLSPSSHLAMKFPWRTRIPRWQQCYPIAWLQWDWGLARPGRWAYRSTSDWLRWP